MVYKNKAKVVDWILYEGIKDKVAPQYAYVTAISMGYLLYLCKKNNIDIEKVDIEDLMPLIPNANIQNIVREQISPGIVDVMEHCSSYYTLEDLEMFILDTNHDYDSKLESSTPQSVAELAIEILNIEDDDAVLDTCSGTLSFISQAHKVNKNANYFGIEINTYNQAVADIKAEVLKGNINLAQGNVLDLDSLNGKMNKVFSNHPFGVYARHLPDYLSIFTQATEDGIDFKRATSADWLFNYKVIKALEDNGVGVSVNTYGSLWNTIDRPFREYFVKNKLIKAVVALGPRLFPGTSIPVAFIILGKNDGPLMMVDASKELSIERRQNQLSQENINTIKQALTAESKISKLVSIEEIEENDFNLNPQRYLVDSIEIENGVELASVIKSITRGAPLSAHELDQLVSNKPTKFQYLMLANIEDNIIDETLPYIKKIEEKYERYCINNKNLLLSKNGYPYKIAVAEVPADKKILANGNFYIIEIDEEKIDPYFLMAFFESEQGVASLKSITVGATIPNIGVSALKKLIIPLSSMQIQREIADRYLALTDEIKIYKHKIVKAKNARNELFDIKE